MIETGDLRLKIAQIGFSIGSVGMFREHTRSIESSWMYKYYEKKLVDIVSPAKDQEKYKSFTETFAGDGTIAGFSARYNRKIELATLDNSTRILVWSTIDDHALSTTTGLSFVKLTFGESKVKNVEFYGEKIPKNKLQGSVSPVYHEVPELNKWHFLEYMSRELKDFDLLN